MKVDYKSLPDNVQQIIRQWVGKKVIIVGDHPHANRVGIVDRLERVATGSYGFIVKCSDDSLLGDEVFVFNQKHWRQVPN